MNGWIEPVNDFSAGWSAWIWRITWQAAIVIAIAWLLTLMLRRWSPQLRSWIWRLAYVKLLLLVVWTTPVKLALLPAAGQESGVRDQESGEKAEGRKQKAETDMQESGVRSQESLADIPHSPFPTPHSDTPAKPQAALTPSPAHPFTPSSPPGATAGLPSSGPPRISLPTALLTLWLIGILAVAVWLARETWKVARLYRSAKRIDRPDLAALVDEVRQRLGLRCKVQLAESAAAAGPMLVKFGTPLVVFPRGMLAMDGQFTSADDRRSRLSAPTTEVSAKPQAANNDPTSLTPATQESGITTQESASVIPHSPFPTPHFSSPALTPDEIRLVLAHELAHVKRHDLAWNGLAAIVHCVLYFHPLIWLAHRFARQEQELACDELVVTRLNVERHQYGELLIKIVRQVGRQFQSGVATVAMSSSYQTLSRRLTAMKTIRSATRRQLIIFSCVLAIGGTLAIVPWRIVAQEPNETHNPPNAKTDAKSAASSESKDASKDNSQSQLVVGTWRSVEDKSVVFFKDGTYEDFGANIFGHEAEIRISGTVEKRLQFQRGQGTWEIQNGFLYLQNDDIRQLWEGHAADRSGPAPPTCRFAILRLDDSFLRLKYSTKNQQNAITLFFRRTATKPIDEEFSAVPFELRLFFDRAQFKGEEAATLVDFLKTNDVDLAPLETIEKIVETRHRKMTLAQLLQLNPAEVAAYRELLTQVGTSSANAIRFRSSPNLVFERLSKLADTGQLSAVEQSAFEKVKVVANSFRTIAKSMPPLDSQTHNKVSGPLTELLGNQRGPSGGANKIDDRTGEARSDYSRFLPICKHGSIKACSLPHKMPKRRRPKTRTKTTGPFLMLERSTNLKIQKFHPRADFVALGMSESYQTLSRRLEAMKTIRRLTRKQVVLLGTVVAMLGVVAVVPWRLVAQEDKPADKNGTLTAPSAYRLQADPPREREKVGEPKDAAQREKQLIGTWRGVLANVDNNSQEETEVVFRGDHTYQDYSRRFFPGDVPGSPVPQMAYDRGRWKINGDLLVLTADTPAIPFLKGLSPPLEPVTDADVATEGAPRPRHPVRNFKIVLLNDSLLRLQTLRLRSDANFGTGAGYGNPGSGPIPATGDLTLFYRRDKHAPADQKYDAAIPAELRDLAEHAGLTPPEALELAEHVKQLNQKLTKAGGKALDLDWAAKVAAVRDDKIDFQKMFDLTDAEAAAYAELMKLTDLHFWGAVGLASRDQLTADESGAVKKLETFYDQMTMRSWPMFCGMNADQLITTIDPKSGEARLTIPPPPGFGGGRNIDPDSGGGVSGLPGGGFGPQNPADGKEPTAKQRMLGKIQNYYNELRTWLDATVFTQ